MKKTITVLFLAMAAMTFSLPLKAQNVYQLPNPGFEQWDGNNIDSEPSHWNSFATCDGSYSSLASSPHHYHRSGGRPGTPGNNYLTIYTKSVIGIKANGNMTTGRIHAGAMSASSSNNYNYTQTANANHCQPFHGTPDSMYVWVSFYASSTSSEAQIEAIIHGNNDFKAPNDLGTPSLYKGHAVANTTRTTSSTTQMQWRQLKVPFSYDGTSSANYILINITTNKNPGEGDANDSLSVDDFEFIYSAWLSSIKINGETIGDFNKGIFNYAIHIDNLDDFNADGLTAETEVADASVEKTVEQTNDTTLLVTFTVTAEDGTTVKVYRVALTTATDPEPPQPPVGIDVAHGKPILKVYPNPATESLTVESQGVVVMRDIRGVTVWEGSCNGHTQIPVAHLPKGVYLVHSGCATQKVIVK